MKRASVLIATLAGFIAATLAFNVLTAHPANAKGEVPVTVSNVPLPIQGTVSVANAPDVNVTNSAVPVSNALDRSNNPAPLLVSTALEPYQSTCTLFATTINDACHFASIPAGKRLVVREFSMQTTTGGGSSVVDVLLLVPWNGSAIPHFFPLTTEGTNIQGQFYQALHQETTIYADSSLGTMTPSCSAEATTASWSALCTISGYLVAAN